MRIGYSYLRYSSAQQGDGDSIRRQTAMAKAWCDCNKVRLDLTTTFTDRGKSAFRGKHRLTGALGVFLKDVEADPPRIPRGSVLIIENLDRLSREDEYEAINLLTSLVIAGISIVTLSPREMLYEKGSNNMAGLISAIVEFGRANSESKTKEGRSDQNWLRKKTLARASGFIMTAAVPAWIAKRDGEKVFLDGELVQKKKLVLDKDGKMTLDPKKAATVRQIFSLAVAGFSLMQIVRRLIAEKKPPIARTEWSTAYISKILRGREVLGELQPRTNGKKPDGEPIKDYYPAVIDEGTWAQAQAAIAGHKKVRGRSGEKIASLFTGMLMDARTQSRMLLTWGTSKGGFQRLYAVRKYRVLLPADNMARGTPRVSFPYDVFEAGILSKLKEISPADILGQESEPESAALAAELAIKEQKIREFENAGIGDVPALVRMVTKLNSEAQELGRRLAIARQKEAKPQSEAWAEAQSLLKLATDEDHRTRLRSVLRRIVDSMFMLVIPRKTHRLAAVQIFFAGGTRRDFLIHYWGAGNGRQSGWEIKTTSFAPGDKKKGHKADLRVPQDVKNLEAALGSINLNAIFPEADQDTEK